MTELERFRDHAAEMAAGAHSPACIAERKQEKHRWAHFFLFREWPEKWGDRPSGPPQPCAGDCVSEADRALWARLAAEVDDYLTPNDAPLWDHA